MNQSKRTAAVSVAIAALGLSLGVRPAEAAPTGPAATPVAAQKTPAVALKTPAAALKGPAATKVSDEEAQSEAKLAKADADKVASISASAKSQVVAMKLRTLHSQVMEDARNAHNAAEAARTAAAEYQKSRSPGHEKQVENATRVARDARAKADSALKLAESMAAPPATASNVAVSKSNAAALKQPAPGH